MSSDKKNDGEIGQLAIGAGISTAILLVVDLFYYNMHDLLTSWFVIPFIIIHVGLLACWAMVIKNFEGPNYDKYRKLAVAVAIAGLLLILGHRAAWKESISVIEDSKQEQRKP